MTISHNKVCVIGIWHLGAVTSVCLADLGYHVVGIDKDQEKIGALNRGQPPLYEPGLAELLGKNLSSKGLHYTADLGEGVRGAGYVLFTYDTPIDENDEVDLSEIYSTFSDIAPYLDDGSTIVVSSQVPVGTCEKLAEKLRQVNPSLNFGIACVPENLRLGQAIERFKHPEMLVIGADSPQTLEKVEVLLSVIKAPRVNVDLRTAEMTKHAINTYLATAISFGNELANLCDEVGADALKVIQALRLDSRVSPKAPLLPGLAFGGGTLARDLKVLQHLAEDHGYEAPLINGVWNVNQKQNHNAVARKLKRMFGSLQSHAVGVLGLTYKAGTSTLRRSAAIQIIQELAAEGATLKAYDPKADPGETAQYQQFRRCADPYQVAVGSDALVVLTEWPEFKQLDYARIRTMMRQPIVLDPQNFLDPDHMIGLGYSYYGTGYGTGPGSFMERR